MGDGINFDSKVAKAMREELTKSYEAAQKMASLLETLANTLPYYWGDESAGDVVELIHNGKLMYEATAKQIVQVQERLKETERIYAMQAAQEAASKAAEQKRRQEALASEREHAQELRERYPDLDRRPKIGLDRYR